MKTIKNIKKGDVIYRIIRNDDDIFDVNRELVQDVVTHRSSITIKTETFSGSNIVVSHEYLVDEHYYNEGSIVVDKFNPGVRIELRLDKDDVQHIVYECAARSAERYRKMRVTLSL